MLNPHSAFAHLPIPPTAGRGLVVSDRDGLALATIQTVNARCPRLVGCLREHFDIELPHGPRRSVSGDLALAGTGPQSWLATSARGPGGFAATLKEAMGDLASVSDQSDGHGILCLSGPKVREVLCKLVPVDLHPRAFQVNDVAVTVAAHVGVALWRLEDAVDGFPAFEISVPRSMAASCWFALMESAAEFGVVGRSSPSVSSATAARAPATE